MPPEKVTPPSASHNTNISIEGDVSGVVVVGDNNTVNQTFVQRITNYFTGNNEQQRARRNRQAMLELVKNIWVKGVLEKSLYNEILIDLCMELHPNAVDHPWDVQVQMPNRPNQSMPLGTSIIEVFEEMNNAILILGEPGSGKTTMMLELARQSIALAEKDSSLPIPVVFNLSSWEKPKKKTWGLNYLFSIFGINVKETMEDWLVKELTAKYYVPKRLAKTWVLNDNLLLLLDGLDEIKIENQEACIEAINELRSAHGLAMPIVVCSRIADYDVLNKKLNLSNAVLLQPLGLEQIKEYLIRGGSEFIEARQVWETDEQLQELVKQPLMLSIMILAYKGSWIKTYEKKPLNATIETRRKHLFDTYIQRMFKPVTRTKNEAFSSEQVKSWLSWLANKMEKHENSIFMLENMQPEWLDKSDKKKYSTVIGAIGALIFYLIYGFIVLFRRGVIFEPVIELIFGLVFSLIVGLAIGFNTDFFTIEIDNELTRTLVRGGRNIGILLTISLAAGLIFGLFLGIIFGTIIGLIIGILVGPFLGLIYAFFFFTGSGSIQITHPKLKWLLKAINFLSIFPIIILSIFVGGISVFGVILHIGLTLGGFALIKHFVLRGVIFKRGFLPWRLTPFLDYCTDRIFLRKVGSGYIFVHRLLMEHFAAMYPKEEK